jgi:Do/DeqQ family serine protease
MNNHQSFSDRLQARATRTIGAAVAALTLLSGAVWHASTSAEVNAADTAAVATDTTTVQRPLVDGRDSYADVVKVVAPAVVTIRVEGRARMTPTQFPQMDDELFRRFFGDQFGAPSQRGQRPQRAPRLRGMGSGVIVSEDGYILTNNHVIDQADEIRVEMTDRRTFTAKIVGTDEATDLALLKVDAANLPRLTLGNSDAVDVGDVVLAVGNPLGVGQTVTMGIISAKGRSTGVGDGSYEDFLQTDAPINQGNSGGALVNLDGELIGINSQILSTSQGNIGIGFAIPANMAKNVMDQLRESGKVTRAQLGVTVQQVTEEMAQSLGLKQAGGAIVSSVADGSAAERAGIKQGDVIMSFNARPVEDFNTLRNRVADAMPGSNASVTVIRDGEEKTLTVKLDEARPRASAANDSAMPGEADKAALGVSVAPLTPELANRLGIKDRDAKGVVIQGVNPDGRAADAGLQPGDVIEQVNRTPVETVEELRSAVTKAGDRPILLLINRDGVNTFVTVRPSNS